MTNNTLTKFKNIIIFVSSIVILWGIILQMQSDRATIWNYLFNSGYGAIFFISGISTLYLRKKENIEGIPGKSLNLFGGSLISYSTALFLWTGYNFIYGEEIPYPGLPDLFFVLFSLLLALSVYYFLKIFSLFLTRKLLIESLIFFLVSSSIIVWAIGPETLIEKDFLTTFLNIFYPVNSALLLSLSIIIARTGGISLKGGAATLSLGIFLNAFSDVFFTIRNNSGIYWNGDISDVVAAISAMVLGLASMKIIEELTYENHKQS